ncbi:MAG: hypothetical protein GX286_04350 [Clostridiales bacterium]|jgi:hypothetical protein|nr:hypothetical protein [Clostridiales bacterium]
MKRKSPYRLILTSMILSSVFIVSTAYYSIGVVSKANTRSTIDKRLHQLENKIKENEIETNFILEEFTNDYEHRANIISMLIAQNPSVLENEVALEEMRSLISADEISITDENGIIRYSTNQHEEEIASNSFFTEAIKNKNYSDTIVSTVNDELVLISGTSRIDSNGIVQIVYTPEKLSKALTYSDISLVTSEFPLYKNGSTAILDINTYKYLSHTNSEVVGLTSQFNEDDFDFENKSGDFYSKINGKKSLVRYSIQDDKIILGIVPVSEVYSTRNIVTIWLLILSVILIFSSYLSVRAFFINHCQNNNPN